MYWRWDAPSIPS